MPFGVISMSVYVSVIARYDTTQNGTSTPVDTTVDNYCHPTDDPVSFVVSVNVKRRHLSTGQLAMLGAELVPMFEAQADKGGRPKTAKPAADRRQVSKSERASAAKAAKVVGTSGRSVATY